MPSVRAIARSDCIRRRRPKGKVQGGTLDNPSLSKAAVHVGRMSSLLGEGVKPTMCGVKTVIEKSAQHILLVEDDQAIADSVIYALKKECYEVTHCLMGKDALLAWEHLPIQVGILDVGLPDLSGFDLCKKLKSIHPERPVLFLTAQNDEIDRIVGLELGADDYLGKPFSPRELVLRVKAILRRSSPSSKPDHSNTLLRHNKEKMHITCNGNKLQLTKSEYLLLSNLMDKPGRVFTRDSLLDVLGETSSSSDRAIDTHIKELRAKLKKYCEHELIITHRGLGYSLDDFG